MGQNGHRNSRFLYAKLYLLGFWCSVTKCKIDLSVLRKGKCDVLMHYPSLKSLNNSLKKNKD